MEKSKYQAIPHNMKAARNQQAVATSIHILVVFTSLREPPCSPLDIAPLSSPSFSRICLSFISYVWPWSMIFVFFRLFLRGVAQWIRWAWNRDTSTGPLARPLARLLASLTNLFAPHCSLRPRAPLRSFVRSLDHLLTLELMGKRFMYMS